MNRFIRAHKKAFLISIALVILFLMCQGNWGVDTHVDGDSARMAIEPAEDFLQEEFPNELKFGGFVTETIQERSFQAPINEIAELTTDIDALGRRFFLNTNRAQAPPASA